MKLQDLPVGLHPKARRLVPWTKLVQDWQPPAVGWQCGGMFQGNRVGFLGLHVWMIPLFKDHFLTFHFFNSLLDISWRCFISFYFLFYFLTHFNLLSTCFLASCFSTCFFHLQWTLQVLPSVPLAGPREVQVGAMLRRDRGSKWIFRINHGWSHGVDPWIK